jgi:hypothetical protein
MMESERRFSLVKPTVDTPFHIDFAWWQAHDSDWRVFLFNLLCEPHQVAYKDQDENVVIDFVDPVTAEVKSVDGLLHTLLNHCAKMPDFITRDSSLISIVFRVFLANNNQPLSPNALSKLINRQSNTILITLSGPTVYKGIRPFDKK